MSFFNGFGRGRIRVFLGLGSNLGNRDQNLKQAIRSLSAEPAVRVRKKSPVYETEPWGVKEQNFFLNQAVEIETSLEPDALLRLCKDIEERMGRKNAMRWGPRTIDADILLFGDRIVKTPELEIPHPKLSERKFILVPLAGIAGNIRVPGLDKTVGVLLKQCPDAGSVRLYRKAKGVSG